MEQEHDNDQGNDNCLLDQTVLQRVYRFANQSAAVIAGNDLDPRRQGSFDLSQLLLDAINHVERVESIAHDDDAANGFAFAVPLSYPVADIGAEGNCSEILDQYWRSVLCHDRHVGQVVQRFEITES